MTFNIIENVLNREINDHNILLEMFDNYEKCKKKGNYYVPPIVKSISSQFNLDFTSACVTVERYVYYQLAKKYIQNM